MTVAIDVASARRRGPQQQRSPESSRCVNSSLPSDPGINPDSLAHAGRNDIGNTVLVRVTGRFGQ